MDSIKYYLALMCSIPMSDGTNPAIKRRNTAFGLWLFTSQFIAVISSVAFLNKSISNDVESSLYAVTQVAAYAGTTYTMIVGYLQQQKTQKLFSEFKKIENKCNSRLILDMNFLSLNEFPFPQQIHQFLSKWHMVEVNSQLKCS